jgi:hypothetical protein
MSEERSLFLALLLLSGALTAACQETPEEAGDANAGNTVAAPGKPTPSTDPGSAAVSPGKPTAPVSIHYTVIGTAVVGQPVSVNLEVSSSQRNLPVTLEYRSNDSSAMVFPESQAQRIEMGAPADEGARMQQVTIIPQREGRLYLNVSASVETENGTLFRSLAVPIQVGPGVSPPAVNGEIQVTPEGETVISLPAKESEGS